MAGRFHIGKIPVDEVGFAEALDRILRLVRDRQGGCVFTPNVDHVMLAERDARFSRAYADASLSLADGMSLVWAARLLGSTLPGKVSGSDLVWPLVERAALSGCRVYLLGGGPGSAEKAAAVMRATLPRLRIVGIDAPRIDVDRPDGCSPAVLERIASARPDLILVGLGAPKQEIWIHRHKEVLRPAVAVAVGASLDFVAGTVRRAPRWASQIGAEWLYRLAREPRRLAYRYLVRDVGFSIVLGRAIAERACSRSGRAD